MVQWLMLYSVNTGALTRYVPHQLEWYILAEFASSVCAICVLICVRHSGHSGREYF